MERTFIERLTDEQIIKFLRQNFYEKKGDIAKFTKTKDYINVVLINSSRPFEKFCFVLGNYSSSNCPKNKTWIKYLYEIYGNEYMKAYLFKCAEIFM